MSHSLGLLSYGNVRLVVAVAPAADLVGRAASIDKEGGKVEILLLFRIEIHLHQCDFDLLVTGGGERRALLFYEYAVYVIGVFFHTVEHIALARRIGVSHRRLHKMTRAVKLVTIPVLKPVLRLLYRIKNIEISVFILHSFYIVYKLINDSLKLRLTLFGRKIGNALHPFGNVGIPEDMGIKA